MYPLFLSPTVPSRNFISLVSTLCPLSPYPRSTGKNILRPSTLDASSSFASFTVIVFLISSPLLTLIPAADSREKGSESIVAVSLIVNHEKVDTAKILKTRKRATYEVVTFFVLFSLESTKPLRKLQNLSFNFIKNSPFLL